MRKFIVFAFFSCLLPYFLNAQKLPKGMDKALAAQEKARKTTEKVNFAKGKRKKIPANSFEFASYGSKDSKQPESNKDILRRINERINSNMSQKKQATPAKKYNSTDFEFGSAKKAISNNKNN
ncbi:MAG: hypothetical protein EAZ13_10260 [Sphingobacteriia bacterium]|nr:MAG: hypothetical protein EAZ13_10260 [Sphingobacteriia bacterium]